MSDTKPQIVKEVPYLRLYDNGMMLVKDVRWSYPHVLVPKEGTDDNGKPTPPSYSIVGLLAKSTHRAAKDVIKEQIELLLKEAKIKMLPAEKKFLRDGDLSGKEENAGCFSISCRESVKNPPKVRGPDKRIWLPDTHESKIYGGCYGNILFRPWFQSNNYGKRVNANLIAVQFLRDGEPFGTGRISESHIDDTFDDEGPAPGAFDDDDVSDL